MRITVYRGCHEIGGNCIELCAGATRVILDVGLPLVNPDRSPFDARGLRGKTVGELLADRTLPPVPGLFTADSPPPDAILLSHAHLDHSGLLPYTRPEVPIFATAGTSKMMLAAAVFGRQATLERARHRVISAGDAFTIGELKITPFAVDHSTFGCLAFLIEGSGKSALYTGDLRAHGRKPGMLPKLLAAIQGKRIDLLLTEGTHLGTERENDLGEKDLENDIVKLVRGTPGIALGCFSPLDLDRLVTYYRASIRTGRIFVADAYAAFVLHLVHREVKVPRPTRANGIRVYFPKPFLDRGETKLHRLFATDRIEWDELLATPDKFVMAFRPSMAELDLAGALPERCRLIYSYWPGYLKNPDWVRVRERIARAGGDFHQAHASGHIRTADLIEFIRRVNAERVVPIHSFEPQELTKEFSNVFLATDGVPFDVT